MSSEWASGGKRKRRKRLWLAGFAALGTTILVGFLNAIGAGIGERTGDAVFDSEPALVSYRIDRQIHECGSAAYFPATKAKQVARAPTPFQREVEWPDFVEGSDAAIANRDVVQVAIEGTSARKVTLTGIRFDVQRQKRDGGATFAAPCGGGTVGRGLLVDVESEPPREIASSASPGGYVESGMRPGGSPVKPIRFPWTVSLADPLLLYVIAEASVLDCSWSAEIDWVSGAESGIIKIDDRGRPFSLVGGEGLPGYTVSSDGWVLSPY